MSLPHENRRPNASLRGCSHPLSEPVSRLGPLVGPVIQSAVSRLLVLACHCIASVVGTPGACSNEPPAEPSCEGQYRRHYGYDNSNETILDGRA
jgi:hypothetical protein